MPTRPSDLHNRFPRMHAFLKRVWYAKKRLFVRNEGVRALYETYERVHGRKLEIDHPERLTEKLFRQMITWHRQGCGPYTNLADKLRVRPYVAGLIGDRYLSQVYWQGRDPADIPFDDLPDRYVLKTNHGSAQVIRVHGPVDRQATVSSLRQWMSTNHYWKEREYQYLHIAPRVFAEEFLEDGEDAGPLDYRFWCFGAKPHVIQVDNHLHDINPFYDCNWHSLDLSYRAHFRPIQVPRPTNLEEMLSVAETLAHGFDFVRVDLYNIRGRIVFGELTFTPVAGFLKFRPESWDIELGRRWPDHMPAS